jgi:citrate lyase beta subunit
MKLRRSLLYMPGTDWRKIEKAATELNADSVCMDLEDGTALNRKEEGRETVVRALQTLDFGATEKLVRINSMDSGLADDDLDAVLPAQPDGIVIPKVRNPNHLKVIHDKIAGYEHRNGWKSGEIGLFLIIESARGVVFLPEIITATTRTRALIFGAEDFASDIGAIRTTTGTEVLYARSKVVTYAASYDLQAIDIVYTDFRNPNGFRADAQAGMTLGYNGKQLIHPNQIELIHEIYTPTDSEIEYAQRVLDAHIAHQSTGAGAFELDGKMVDMPVVRAAEQVLARAQASAQG